MVDEIVRKKLPFLQPEDRRDVRQDALLKVFKEIGTWRGECPFCFWVRQIAVRAAYDQSRREQRLKRLRKAGPDVEGLVDYRPQPLPTEVFNCVDRILHRLPEDMRAAYELRIVQEKTMEETAQAVGKSVRTITNWLDKVRERVLACLD